MPTRDDRPGPIRVLLPAALLTLGGVGVGSAAIVGVADPDVPGSLGSSGAAAWIAVLPGVLALLVAAVAGRSASGAVAAAAIGAGAGVASAVRLVSDLFVVLQPRAVARPELFYPLDGRAFPLGPGGGSALLLLADAVMLVAGVLAARILARQIATADWTAPDWTAPAGDAPAGDAPAGDAPAGDAPAGSVPTERGAADPWSERPPTSRNMPMLLAGVLAVAVLGLFSAILPYAGGYVDAWLSVPGSDVGTMITPFLLALLAVGAVVMAGGMPRSGAVGLLAGVSATLVVPALVAIVVAAGDAPVSNTAGPVGMLIGGLALVASGTLTRVRWRLPAATDDDDGPDRASDPGVPTARTAPPDGASSGPVAPGRILVLTGACGVLAGVGMIVATLLPPLVVDGATADRVPGLDHNAVDLPLLIAGAVTVAAGLVAAVRHPRARTARAALLVAWASPGWIFAAQFAALGRFQVGTERARVAVGGNTDLVAVTHWSAGPGMWLTAAACVLGVAAAVTAGIALGRETDADLVVPDDDADDRARRTRRLLAAVAVLVAAVSLAVPIRSGAGDGLPPLFALGSDGVWGTWVLLLGVVVAAVAGSTGVFPASAAGPMGGAAVAVAVRLLAAPLAAGDGDRAATAGVVCGWISVVVLLAAGAAMWRCARDARRCSRQTPMVANEKGQRR